MVSRIRLEAAEHEEAEVVDVEEEEEEGEEDEDEEREGAGPEETDQLRRLRERTARKEAAASAGRQQTLRECLRG